MITVLTIFSYLLFATVDGLDKFLISKRKILPASYTFWTVVTGVAVVVAWPWVYESLPARSIVLDAVSGAFFALVMYVFFKAMSGGEVSRVVPFVFGLVPVFDIMLAWVFHTNVLRINEVAAICLLVPGALLMSYHKGFAGKHIALKVLSAFLWSSYFALWQFSAQTGNPLNHFMWNRIGAAAVLVSLLLLPIFRKSALKHEHVKNKKNTAGLFLFKQALGGGNFIFFSWLLVAGKISVINSMQGFRYAFLFLGALFLSKKMRHILNEDVNREAVLQKIGALVLIFLGTIFLFV